MICAFRGTIIRDAEVKTVAKTGREFLKLAVIEGDGERAQSVSVMGWRDTFTELAPRLRKGTEVLVKGRVELRTWNGEASLSVSAEVIEIADVLLDDVRKKPRAGKKAKVDSQAPIMAAAPAFNDSIDDLF